MPSPTGEKLIADNRRARHDYELLDRVEAGLVLTGTEVKSLREGRVTLPQAYAEIRGARVLKTQPAHAPRHAGRLLAC